MLTVPLDILVHRLLAAAIAEHPSLDTSLGDKDKMKELCEHLNERHRAAQISSRSSVELFTLLFFRGKTADEEGYVIRVLANGFVVLIPRYGLEGVVYVAERDQDSQFVFDEAAFSLSSPLGVIRIFDRVKVRIGVDDSSVRKFRLNLTLLEPFALGDLNSSALKRRKLQ